mmetsp:Transcript_5758/g.5953  ORF Transcript_5758/g.5953 Transcript_5758/m.5953 type:complete len:141 (+) Transcript_5758:192-614(+)
MLERLPGATEENIEKSIQNLEEVEKKGLRAYLDRTDEERKAEAEGEGPGDGSGFRSFEPVLGTMVDECLNGLGESFRFTKTPRYRCSCGMDRIWRTLSIIPREELMEIIETEEIIEMKCEFCGTKYSVTKEQILQKIVNV